MTAKQVRFCQKNGVINGGVAVYDKYGKLYCVVCGCCGTVFKPDSVLITEEFDWLPISDNILDE